MNLIEKDTVDSLTDREQKQLSDDVDTVSELTGIPTPEVIGLLLGSSTVNGDQPADYWLKIMSEPVPDALICADQCPPTLEPPVQVPSVSQGIDPSAPCAYTRELVRSR